MKKITSILFYLVSVFTIHAQSTDDFFIGLMDDRLGVPKTFFDRIMTAKNDRNIQIDYRYRYLNGGVDTTRNWYSWDYISVSYTHLTLPTILLV